MTPNLSWAQLFGGSTDIHPETLTLLPFIMTLDRPSLRDFPNEHGIRLEHTCTCSGACTRTHTHPLVSKPKCFDFPLIFGRASLGVKSYIVLGKSQGLDHFPA